MDTAAHQTARGESPVIRLVLESPKVRYAVLAVVTLQLATSLRFFHKYVETLPWLAYAVYVVTGVVIAAYVLAQPRLLRLVTRREVFALGISALFLMVLVAYPRADALREVGRGSDQDDCVKTLVGNVVAGRAPYGYGYFDDPCSTGPTEFFVYFPVQLSTSYFMVVPVLSLLLGYWVLRHVSDRETAIALSLTQLVSWLFLEMAAVGSDMIIMAWLFAAGVVFAGEGLRSHRTALVVAGAVAYCLFAGSRLPLVVVAAGSLWALVVVFRSRALVVAVPVVVTTSALYLGTYAVAPDEFTPGHLVGKSARVIRYLGGGTLMWLILAALVVLALLALSLVRKDLRSFVQNRYFPVNLVFMTFPMGAVALWDLSRRDYDPALWEGLHYLYLCVPALLVSVAHRLRANSGPTRFNHAETPP